MKSFLSSPELRNPPRAHMPQSRSPTQGALSNPLKSPRLHDTILEVPQSCILPRLSLIPPVYSSGCYNFIHYSQTYGGLFIISELLPSPYMYDQSPPGPWIPLLNL